MNHIHQQDYRTATNFVRSVSARSFALFLGALALSLATLRAEVRTDSSVAGANNGARVTYSTGNGVSVSQVGNGNYSYDPDGVPGHQFFHQTLGISGGAVITNGTADLTHGVLRADAAVGNRFNGSGTSASSGVQFLDNITFSNSTGQPATITVNWKVEGALAVSQVTENAFFSRANYSSTLRFDGPGIIAYFTANGILNEPTEANNSASADAQGWQSSSVQRFNGGYGGAVFNGTLIIPPQGISLALNAILNVSADGDAPSASNFGNTAALTLTLPPGVSFTSTDGILNAGSRMVNIATRARVLGGDSVSIAGFIVTGNVPKKVLIRGIGPSLAPFGISPLPNPTLQLNRDNTVLTTNDDWQDSQQTEIQNSGLAPTNDKESAIIRTLDPGNYTAILRDKSNGSGIGVVQVYDLDASADSKLANISTRAFIEPGDNVLFAGMIGGGNGSQPQVLITARGPSLANFGVPNPISDPFLELHDKDGALIASNNDWQSDQKDAIAATGVAPPNSKESALLVTLRPAENYSAIIKDANNASGVALVEVYHLQ